MRGEETIGRCSQWSLGPSQMVAQPWSPPFRPGAACGVLLGVFCVCLWQATASCPPSGPFSAAPCQDCTFRCHCGGRQAVWEEIQRGGAQLRGSQAALWALARWSLCSRAQCLWGGGRRVLCAPPMWPHGQASYSLFHLEATGCPLKSWVFCCRWQKNRAGPGPLLAPRGAEQFGSGQDGTWGGRDPCGWACRTTSARGPWLVPCPAAFGSVPIVAACLWD